MALPGLGLAGPSGPSVFAPGEESTDESRTITLNASSEWRFENSLSATTNVQIRPLTDVSYTEENAPCIAELFGAELVPNNPYTFSGVKAAIYTPEGCRLDISGSKCDTDYVAEETDVPVYANIHFALENLRAAAAATRARNPAADTIGGPRVLVLGPDHSGKTSLVKTLAAYAVRGGRSPCVVNLDPREGMLCLPGSVSAAVFGPGSQMDVEDAGSAGWGGSPIQGSSAVPLKMPLVYHFGAERPEDRFDMFNPVVGRLALAVTSRFEEDEPVKEAGILVDLAGSVCSAKGGMEVIEHVISEFSINIVLVLNSERTASDLQKKYSQPNGAGASTTHPRDASQVTILKFPKPGGAVDRDADYQAALRTEAVKTYFFGTRRQPLSPHTTTLPLADLPVLRMPSRDDAALASAFVPGDIGEFGGGGGARLFEPATLDAGAVGAVLAIKHAAHADAMETVRDAPVLGYLYVAEVDMEKKRVRVTSPVGGMLPQRAIVWGRWPESVGAL